MQYGSCFILVLFLFAFSGPLVLAANLYLPALAPNLYLPALARQFVFNGPVHQFVLTGPGPKFSFTGPGQPRAWACIHQHW